MHDLELRRRVGVCHMGPVQDEDDAQLWRNAYMSTMMTLPAGTTIESLPVSTEGLFFDPGVK